jgi:hypothetical protein
LRITLDRLAQGKLSTGHNEYGVQFVSFARWHRCTDDKIVQSYNDVHDPAKLAKLWASALRSRGYTGADGSVDGNYIWIGYRGEDGEYLDFAISATEGLANRRAQLLAFMVTPAEPSSKEQCELIIDTLYTVKPTRGEHDIPL